jgi:hypothetical protein
MVLLRTGATALAATPARREVFGGGGSPSPFRTSRATRQIADRDADAPNYKRTTQSQSKTATALERLYVFVVAGAEQREEPNPVKSSRALVSASLRLSTELSRFVQVLVIAYTQDSHSLSTPRACRSETLACCQTLSPYFSVTTNSGRPYRRFARKSRHFHYLARKNPAHFCHALSRVDAAHTRIVGHAVNGQHVGGRARVHIVLIGVSDDVVEAGDHYVL